ncbi:diguanylate cyclase [Salinisphaera sp. SPP-AMP-43]|uniref:sensor domain-containing diguanylate cyclase n=1 Tax=Salinisphaera sp. SPP-AMP-43 TaxID=3121288 RepID=UPI003C6E59AB
MALRIYEPVTPPDLAINRKSVKAILSHLFIDLPQAVLVADRERRVISVNPAACQLFRYKEQELIGQSTSSLYANAADFVEQGEKRFNSDAQAVHDQYLMRYQRSDHSVFTGETIAGPIRESPEAPPLYMALIRDVSARLKADEVLEKLYNITCDPSLSFEQTQRAILELGRSYFAMPLGLVSNIDDHTFEIREAIDVNDETHSGDIHPTAETFCSEIVARRGPYATDRLNDSAMCEHPAFRRFGLGSYIGAPLYLKGDFIGTIAFCSPRSTGGFTDEHLKIVAMFAQWLSHEIERNQALVELQQAHAKLQQIATQDELTGLGNRRQLTEYFDREQSRAERYSRPLSVALVDFDHFKQLNDQYGHAAGDAALQLFAKVANATLRSSDLVGRWGGEEFIIVLPDTPVDAAKTVIDRLLGNIRTAPFEPGSHRVVLTASAGLASTLGKESLEDVLSRADGALYAAKAAGRDRALMSADPLRGPA